MELNREDIIKALECCASPNYICGECPIDQKIKEDCVCGQFASQLALTLIKQLTEENERLKEKADRHLDNLKAVLDERAEEKSGVEKVINEIADLMWQGESEKLNISLGGHYYNKQEFIADLKKKYIGEKQ